MGEWENEPLRRRTKSVEQTKTGRNELHSLKSQPIFSEAPQTEWREHLIFQPEFPVFPGK